MIVDLPAVNRSAESVVRFFVLWVFLAGVAALFWPAGFTWFQPLIIPGLGVIMFGMGTALTLADFKQVAEQPYPVAVGLVAQFLIMPSMAAAIAKLFELPPAIAAGLILVGSCSGGTASNVITYLAKGDVALSVTMTSCSTIASVVATPYLMLWLAGTYVSVHPQELLLSILTVVIFPVAAGLIVRQFLGGRARQLEALLPVVSVILIVLVIACIVALSRAAVRQRRDGFCHSRSAQQLWLAVGICDGKARGPGCSALPDDCHRSRHAKLGFGSGAGPQAFCRCVSCIAGGNFQRSAEHHRARSSQLLVAQPAESVAAG
jgi:predicted Na+-dependent transporter